MAHQKALWYRYYAERSGPKRPRSLRRPRRNAPIDTALPGVSASDRRAAGTGSGRRNVSTRAGRNAPYVLEQSATGRRPSRRSTRKSEHHSKPAHRLYGLAPHEPQQRQR